MKFLFFIICFALSIHAKTMIIDENFTMQNAFSYTGYLETNERSLAVVKEHEFYPLSKKNFSYRGKNIFWTKITIENNSYLPQHIIAINPRTGMDIVNMYVLSKEKLVYSFEMGDNQPFKNRSIKSRYSNIEVTVEPNGSIDLYVMLQNKGPMVAETIIYSATEFMQNEFYELMTISFLFTFIIIIIIYSALLVKSIRQNAFLVYLLYTSTAFFFFASSNGFIAFVSNGALLHLQDIITLYGYPISAICLIYFHLLFFRIKYIAPMIFKMSIPYVGLSIFIILTIFFQQHYFTSVLIPIWFAILCIYTQFIIGFAIYKKLEYAKYYFVGHTFDLVGLWIFMSYSLGYVDETFFTRNAGMIGFIIEGFVIAVGMNTIIQKEIKKKQQMASILAAQSQFLSVGKQLASIVHQWKVPLNRISTISAYFEMLLSKQEALNVENFRQGIFTLNETVTFMNETVTTFHDFYRAKDESKYFNPMDVTNKIIKMVKPILDSNKIEIVNINTIQDKIYSKAHIFEHIILVLVQNAINAHSKTESEDKYIKLHMKVQDNIFYFSIHDNAGGINKTKLLNLFNDDINSNEGLGLKLTYFLVCEQLKGTINASNNKKGAIFELTFPLNHGIETYP